MNAARLLRPTNFDLRDPWTTCETSYFATKGKMLCGCSILGHQVEDVQPYFES